MAKAFFKFDLNELDDLQEFHCMSKAKNLVAALWEVGARIRESEKYGKEAISLHEFYELLSDRDINLDELYA